MSFCALRGLDALLLAAEDARLAEGLDGDAGFLPFVSNVFGILLNIQTFVVFLLSQYENGTLARVTRRNDSNLFNQIPYLRQQNASSVH